MVAKESEGKKRLTFYRELSTCKKPDKGVFGHETIVFNAQFRCKGGKKPRRTSKCWEPRAIENSSLCSYSPKNITSQKKSWNIPSLRVEGPGNTHLVSRTTTDQCLLYTSHSSLFQEPLLWHSYFSFITVSWVCGGQTLSVFWSQSQYKAQLRYITSS